MDSLLGTLKPMVGALLMPMPIFLGLMLLGLALLAAGRRRLGWSFSIAAVLSLALASWRPVADGLLGALEDRYPAVTDPLTLVQLGGAPGREGAGGRLAAIVVLGGGWWPNDQWPIGSQLSEASAMRLLEGVRLARALPAVPLILSGSDRGGEIPPVAIGYAQAARELGIAPERIRVLDKPVDTAQEARAVREALVGTPALGQRLALVTSAAHMPRAMQHFQAVGLDPIPAPTHHLAGRASGRRLADWLPSAGNLRKTESALHEYLGLVIWRWDHLGRLAPSTPAGP